MAKDTSSPAESETPKEDAPATKVSEGEPASVSPEGLHDATASGLTKMAQATEIYRRMTRRKGITRKEIIEVFIEKVGLSKAGAATYYQMIKKARRQD